VCVCGGGGDDDLVKLLCVLIKAGPDLIQHCTLHPLPLLGPQNVPQGLEGKVLKEKVSGDSCTQRFLG